jgi:hypothetical protein
MDTDMFRIEDAVSFTFEETDPLALMRIDTDRSFYTMSASECKCCHSMGEILRITGKCPEK